MFTPTFSIKKRFVIFSGIALVMVATLVPLNVFAETGSIGGKPANPDSLNPRTQSIFLKTISPNETVADAVKVINNTNEKKTILVYATDSVPSSGGAFACAQAVDTAKSVGSWIKISQTSVEVASNSSQTVPFSITAPTDAEPGEQNGCIVLQEQKEVNFQSGIALNFRTAIRVAVLVPGEIRKELTLLGIGVSHNGSKVILNPSVKNTGNVSLDAKIDTRIKTVIGTTVSSQTSKYPILRDQITEWNFEMDSPFWGGFYTASYDVEYDASPTFIGSTEPKQLTSMHGQQKIFFAIPHILALLLYALLIAAITTAVVAYRQYRLRKANIKTHWVEYIIKDGDNIQNIAKTQHVRWTTLAKTNNIKPPYILEPGKTIKVPGAKTTTKKRSTQKK